MLIEYGHKYTITKKIDIPKEFLENQKDTLDSNDEVKLFIDDVMEFDKDYKLGKHELEFYPIFKKLGLKRINDDFKRLGFHYIKDSRKDNKKGVWLGLRIKIDYGDSD